MGRDNVYKKSFIGNFYINGINNFNGDFNRGSLMYCREGRFFLYKSFNFKIINNLARMTKRRRGDNINGTFYQTIVFPAPTTKRIVLYNLSYTNSDFRISHQNNKRPIGNKGFILFLPLFLDINSIDWEMEKQQL